MEIIIETFEPSVSLSLWNNNWSEIFIRIDWEIHQTRTFHRTFSLTNLKLWKHEKIFRKITSFCRSPKKNILKMNREKEQAEKARFFYLYFFSSLKLIYSCKLKFFHDKDAPGKARWLKVVILEFSSIFPVGCSGQLFCWRFKIKN